MSRAVLSLAVAGALLGGCVMDLPTGVLVDRPRVIGVRVDVEGDTTQAAPRAGETATLRWMVASPGERSQWTYALSACVAVPSNSGLPACAGPPLAVGLETTPVATPAFSLTLPDDATGTILVAGVLCAEGTPTLDGEDDLPGCAGEVATTERVVFSFALAGEDPPNRHPEWADDALTLDGAPWGLPPADLEEGACAGRDDLPRLALRPPEEPSEVGFTTRAVDRERYGVLVLGETPMVVERDEELRVTHVATAGRFARLQSDVFDESSAVGAVPWQHPDEVPADGLAIRFWFVLRDPRGGMALTERALCLVP